MVQRGDAGFNFGGEKCYRHHRYLGKSSYISTSSNIMLTPPLSRIWSSETNSVETFMRESFRCRERGVFCGVNMRRFLCQPSFSATILELSLTSPRFRKCFVSLEDSSVSRRFLACPSLKLTRQPNKGIKLFASSRAFSIRLYS
jgi:hypothetical protein